MILLCRVFLLHFFLSLFLKSLTVSIFLLSERRIFLYGMDSSHFLFSFSFLFSNNPFIWEGGCPPRLRSMIILFHPNLDLWWFWYLLVFLVLLMWLSSRSVSFMIRNWRVCYYNELDFAKTLLVNLPI